MASKGYLWLQVPCVAIGAGSIVRDDKLGFRVTLHVSTLWLCVDFTPGEQNWCQNYTVGAIQTLFIEVNMSNCKG